MANIQDIIMKFSREVKEVLGVNLSRIILYGSYARGEQRDNSDVDIMILTSLSDDEIKKVEPVIFDLAFEYEMKYFVNISVIVKNEEHFHYWLGALPFYDNVEREGVVLNGQ